MKRYLNFYWLVRGLTLFLILIGTVGTTSYAALSESEYQQLVDAYKRAGTEPQAVLVKLQGLQQRLAQEPIEIRAQVSYLFVEIYQRLKQWDAAIQHLVALQQQLTTKNRLYLNGEIWLTYLYYQQQAYPLCVTQANKLFEQQYQPLTSEKAAELSLLLSYCYYHQKKLPQALYWSLQANQRNMKPNEAWLRFSVSLYQSLHQWRELASFIEQSVLPFYPTEKIYWQSLLSAYLQVEQYSNALSVMELMPQYIKFDQRLSLQKIALYRLLKQPYQAALQLDMALQQGVVLANREHYLLLVELWIQARHRSQAIETLNILLSNKLQQNAKQKGELLLQRASLALQQGNWRLLQQSLLTAKRYLSELNLNWNIWLAKSFVEQGDWQRAEAVLESLQPQDNQQVRYLLNYIHFIYPATP